MQPTTQKINLNEIQFIRPLDELMKVFHSTDKEYFCKLLERKKQLIEQLMAIGIDNQKYFALVTKMFKSDTPLKQYAKNDLVSLKYQYEMNKETWFQDIVVQTQTALTEQQNLYNQYKAQMNKPAQQKAEQISHVINPNINITEITNFKLFDNLMQKYYETPYRQLFIDLYEKKQRILQSIQSGKLSAELYFEMSNKVFHETKNEEVKQILKSDFEDLQLLCDGDKKRWLKDAMKESKAADSTQKQIYELHKKGQVVNKRQPKQDVDLDELMNVPIPENTDLNDCVSFAVIDRYMDKVSKTPQKYVPLYEMKQNLLNQIEEGKLNEKQYKENLQKKIKSTKNQILKQMYESEIDNIQDLYSGDEKKWFENLVDKTQIELQMQKDTYQEHKLTYKPVQKKIEIKQEPKKETLKKPQQQKSPLPFAVEKLMSLKVIEDAFLMYQSNPQAFIKLFQQKQKIIDLMKNGQLDATKYKKLQQKMLTVFEDNQAVKDEIQMDLQGIKDFHDDNVDEWFQETVERAGEYYESQQEKYQQLTKNLSKQIVEAKKQVEEVKVQQNPKQEKKQEETPEPFSISKLVSLKVLDESISEHMNDQKLFMKLFAQKQKIIDLMQNGKLDAPKYKKLQQKMLQEFKENESVKDSISFELDEINDMHDGDVQKWFQEVVQNAGTNYQYQLEKYNKLQEKYKEVEDIKEESIQPRKKIKNEKAREQCKQQQFDSKLSEASLHINQTTPKSKIRYYLHQMAPYESLTKYFQKHGLNPNDNPMIKIYLRVPRHEILEIIQKIQTEPNYDIVSYCEKFFPPITPSIFYQGNQNYEEKFKKGIIGCNKEIESLKQYTKMIRKGLNIKNLEKVKQRIQICQENIKYLTDLSVTLKNTNKLIPLPLIEQISVSYPSIDENSHLEQNQVQLKILRIQGLDGEHAMKVYFSGNKIHEGHVKNGSPNLTFKKKMQSSENFIQMLKGDLKCFQISLYKIGWFSNTKLGQAPAEMLFIRSNITQGKTHVANATIYYEARVKKPKNPVITEIKEIRVTKYPPYQQSKQVQQEFIKKYTPSSKSK